MHNLQPMAMARHGMYLNGERFLEVSGRGVLEVSQRKGQGARSITPVRSQRAGDKPRPAAIWLAAGGTRVAGARLSRLKPSTDREIARK